MTREIFSIAPKMFSDIYNVELQNGVTDAIKTIDQMQLDSHLTYGHNYDYLESKDKLNIVFTSREFQPYANNLVDAYHFAGNSLGFRKKSAMAHNCHHHNNRKTILISFGSWMSSRQNYLDFYKSFMEHFGGFDASFILNIGTIPKENFEYVPNNFNLENSINQLKLLEYADLFITHGGMNSASEALQLNTPMLVFPQFFDQFIVAEQVEKSGMGRQYSKSEVDFYELEQLITDILGRPSYHQALSFMADTYRATGEEKVAVDRIFNYVGKSGKS